MNVLITGSRGYIGSTLAKTVTRLGHIPVGVDREINPNGSTIYGLFHQANFEDDYVAEIICNLRINNICHLAADASVPHSISNPGMYYENNVGATIKLLNNLARRKWKGNFIFSSSAAVYPSSSKLMGEDVGAAPMNPYGYTKIMGEQILKDFHDAHGINVVCFRYFNVAGAWDDVGDYGYSEHVIQKLIHAAHTQNRFYIYGSKKNTPDGTCLRDYLHVRDVCDSHVKAIEFLNSNPGYYTFNLGTGVGTSVKQLVNSFIAVTGQAVMFDNYEDRAGDPDSLVADGSKFIAKTGYTYKHSSIDNIISTAWDYHKIKRRLHNDCF